MLAALPTMQREFLLAPTVPQWVVNAYLVASAACVILGGKATDRCAAAAVSTAGVAAFGIASVVITVAPIAALVVAGRLTHPARHDLVAARWSPSMTTKRTQ